MANTTGIKFIFSNIKIIENIFLEAAVFEVNNT